MNRTPDHGEKQQCHGNQFTITGLNVTDRHISQ